MNLLDRFSTHLREALTKSIQIASKLNNAEVLPLHLLLALSDQRGSVAGEILGRFKLTPESLEGEILKLPKINDTSGLEGNPTQKILPPLSTTCRSALEKAISIAHAYQHNFIGTEHMLAALLRLANEELKPTLAICKVNEIEIKKQLENVLSSSGNLSQISDMSEIAEKLQQNLGDNPDLPEIIAEPRRGKKKESALEFFATNLTDPEKQINIDPVIGRNKEVDRVIQILCRRTKNNPLLLGDPGVGKTAIAEGLAKRILEGKVPDLLANKKIYALDIGLMISGTIYRGEFEGRLKQVVEEVTKNPNIILFIDEVHNIVGAGSNQGTMDAANLLKPALSRGQIRCIGATTPTEFKKYIENDAALERRFEPVRVKEPSIEETEKILIGIKKNYENFHNVEITDAAIRAAVRLSSRYIVGKFLPDKAIDLIDETSAGKRILAKRSPAIVRLTQLEEQLEKATQAKEVAARSDKFAEAVDQKKEEGRLRAEIEKQKSVLKKSKTKICGQITEHDIAEQVARVIGNAPADLITENHERLDALDEALKKFIIGQDEAVNEVAKRVRRAKLGLGSPERPLASMIFVGPSGVGKTELAKVLAKTIYPGQEALIQLNMSEFNESFSVSKMLGSPAGYVGYKESNQFADKIKLNPYCVILFDEADKAHRDVMRLLLQILENGEITDSTGRKISLKHAIIILTTTLGADDHKKGSIGFGGIENKTGEAKEKLVEKLKEHFSPEIINRLDSVCVFRELTAVAMAGIAELELARFNEQLREYKTMVKSETKVVEWLIGQIGKDKGARDVRRALRDQLETLATELILSKKIKKTYQLTKVGEKLALK